MTRCEHPSQPAWELLLSSLVLLKCIGKDFSGIILIIMQTYLKGIMMFILAVLLKLNEATSINWFTEKQQHCRDGNISVDNNLHSAAENNSPLPHSPF